MKEKGMKKSFSSVYFIDSMNFHLAHPPSRHLPYIMARMGFGSIWVYIQVDVLTLDIQCFFSTIALRLHIRLYIRWSSSFVLSRCWSCISSQTASRLINIPIIQHYLLAFIFFSRSANINVCLSQASVSNDGSIWCLKLTSLLFLSLCYSKFLIIKNIYWSHFLLGF